MPFVNYLGWYLTVYLFLQAFALYKMRRDVSVPALPEAYWYQAPVFYAVMAIDFVAGYWGGADTRITDATGKVWQTGDIFATAAIMGLFVMLPFAVASFVTLLLRDDPAKM